MLLVLAAAALAGPRLAPLDPSHTEPLNQFAPPSQSHPLGTDELGRDILSRFLSAAQPSLGGAMTAWMCAAVLGALLSIFSFIGLQQLDRAVGYMLDVLLAFPGLLVALIATALLGRGTFQIALAVGLSLAPTFARMLRGAILAVRAQPFIGASYALGAGRWWVAVRHVLRNVAPSMVSIATVILGWAMLDCAALEFLGLAGSPELATWGGMIGVGRAYIREAPWEIVAPSLALCLSVFSLMLAGNLGRFFRRPSP